MAGVLQHRLRRIEDADALHCAQIDGRAIINVFGGQNGAAHDVVDVGPVADLGAIAPDLKGILTDERPGDHRHDGVIFHTPGAIHGEVAARGCADAILAVVRLQGQLTHELCPAVQVVRVVGSPHQTLRQVELLIRLALQEAWIHAAGRCKDNLLDAGLVGFPEHQPIQEQV